MNSNRESYRITAYRATLHSGSRHAGNSCVGIAQTGRKFTGIIFRRRLLSLCLSMLMSILLITGCASGSSAGSDEEVRKIYYLSTDLSSLVTDDYSPADYQKLSSMSREEQVQDVVDHLQTAPEDQDAAPVIRNFSVDGTSLDGAALTVSLSADYASLDSTLEVLTRAAMVMSLCQIDGVDSVSFLCGSQSLKDPSGNDVGAETADMFINNSDKEITDYAVVQLHLYFASETGDQLVDTYRNVVYNANISMERLVVEQVLKGPNSDTVFPTLNPATKILSVTTRDGVCYVNMDQSFLTEPYNVTSGVAIYSLVNSLTQLPTVNQVQITIEGDSSRRFMDISLSAPFSQDLSVVRNS